MSEELYCFIVSLSVLHCFNLSNQMTHKHTPSYDSSYLAVQQSQMELLAPSVCFNPLCSQNGAQNKFSDMKTGLA